MSTKRAHKTWMITDHEISPEREDLYKRWSKDCSRMVVTKEICPKTGKEHYQCRMTFTHAKRWAAVKKLNDKCHWEVAQSDCFIYEQKADSKVIVEVDNRKQGSRTDITEALKAIKDGAGKRKMWEEHGPFMVKHSKCYSDAKAHLGGKIVTGETEFTEVRIPKPDLDNIKKSKVVVLYGDPGIGKTTAIDQWLTNVPHLTVTDIDDLKGFDQDVHKAIVFDDFAPERMSREQKLALFEQGKPRTIRCRYENAEIPKGTLKIFSLNKIWWDQEDMAFDRRIHWVECDPSFAEAGRRMWEDIAREEALEEHARVHAEPERTPNKEFQYDTDSDDDFQSQ